MIELKKKPERWDNPLVNKWIRQILQLLDEKGPLYIREFKRAGFVGSQTTMISYVNLLEKLGFVSTKKGGWRGVKRLIELTEKGGKALGQIDKLGEMFDETKN